MSGDESQNASDPNEKQSSSAEAEREDELNAYRFLSRHLLALSCTNYLKKDGTDRRRFIASGFLIALGGEWFMATAGHVIEDIEKFVKESPERDYFFRLIDYFGPEPTTNLSLTFDYIDAYKIFHHDESQGVDFGLIHLREFVRIGMGANPQLPLAESQWRNDPDISDPIYLLIGIPAEGVDKNISLSSDSTDHNQDSAFVLRIDEIMESDLPANVPRKQFPTFYGALRETPGLSSIEGMSGCPIIAIGKTAKGQTKYWVVAVQSYWHPNRMPRILGAGRFKPLMMASEAYFNTISQHIQSDSNEAGS